MILCPNFFVSGFTSVIPGSKTDRYLSRCAFERDLSTDDLIQAFERANQFQAATIVSQWLANVHSAQDINALDRTRGESSASERSYSIGSRSRWTSGASEHSEVRTRSTEGSSASEGSPSLVNKTSVNEIRNPLPRASPQQSFDSPDRKESGASENSLLFDVEKVRSSSGFSSSGGSFTGGNLRPRFESASSASGLSYPTEESFWVSHERLSREVSQTSSTEQVVPEPRLVAHPCSNCKYCETKLPAQDNEGTEPPLSIEETSQDTGANAQRKDSDRDALPSPIQVSDGVSEEEASEKESIPTCETAGEPELGESFPSIRQLIPQLSTRLSVNWRPVAVDLGVRGCDLRRLEDSSLLRVQASGMLKLWLDNNKCSFKCADCQNMISKRLAEAFENAHRADLMDFLQH